MIALLFFWIMVMCCVQIVFTFKIYQKMNIFEMLINNLSSKTNLITLDEIKTKTSNSSEESQKKTGGNRNSRTEEQKLLASARKKEWWDKKRAQDSSKSSELQLLTEGHIPVNESLVSEKKLHG